MTTNIELAITDRCNLGCKYCYVKNRNNTMTKDTLLRCIPKIHQYMQTFKDDTYSISYFGGEPLMNFDLIKFAYEIFSRDPKCKYQTIISNGTLVNYEIYSWIKSHNIGFSWSFDGLNSNSSRPLLPIKENNDIKNVIDIFKRYKKELLDISGYSAHVMIYPENVQDVCKNFEYLLSEWDLKNIGFTLVRDDVWNNSSINILKSEIKKLRLLYTKILKNNLTNNISIGLFDNWINEIYLGLKGLKFTNMCFAGCNGLGISPDGEVYGCQRFASNKQFKLSEYDLGNIAKNVNQESYEKCKSCDIRKFCRSLCKYSIIKNNNTPIDSLCEINHFMVQETMALIHDLRDSEVLASRVHWL